MAVTINIPSQVKTYANLAAFPASGSLKTIYIAEDTNKTYRWDGSTYVEISASAATGLTVGTTPIASGTIGRVLFQGTGNVLQQSSSLFWDGTNNRLGIGTSSPSYQLHVVGSAGFDNGASGDSITLLNGGFIQAGLIRFRGFSTNFILQDNSYNTKFAISTAGNLSYFNTGGNVAIGTTTDAGFRLDVNGTAIFRSNITLNSNALYIGTNSAMTLSTSNSDIILSNGNTNRKIIFNNTVAGQFQFNNGNLLINTTTDDGFRLDVNGTARVQGALNVTTSVTANTASSGTGYEGYKIQDGANARFVAERLVTNFLGIGHNSTAGRWDDVILGAAQRLYFYTGASERARFAATTGNFLINTTTDAGYKLDVNGTARINGNLTISNGTFYFVNQYTSTGDFWISASGTTNVLLSNGANNNFGRLQLGGTSSAFPSIKRASNNIEIKNADDTFGAGLSVGAALNTSAILQADSTTKGFLPPRMTTAQKNAIASPATGLQVYDTTLNRPCFYDGTTWITL